MVSGFAEVLSALFSRGQRADGQGIIAQEHCLVCNALLVDDPLYATLRVCSGCHFHYSITSRQRIQMLTDPKSFKEKFRTISSLDPLSFSGKVPYRKRLFRDQRRTGLTEAAVVGQCRIGGVKSILVLLDFSFMSGSMGCVVGEKVALAFEYAARKRLPVVALVTSGGVRLQEGVLSLMQMAKTTAAVNRLHNLGLPYVTVFANPTTGQVYTSFANLADVLLAEPGALVGFAPLRLLQQMTQGPLPLGSHTAEAHLTHGMIDATVSRENLRDTLVHLMSALDPSRGQTRFLRPRGRPPKPTSSPETWEAVTRVRNPERPTASYYVNRLLTNPLELHGDRLWGDDQAITCTIGDFRGCTVIAVGQERQRQPEGDLQSSYIQPEGFHKAQRAMRMAAKFGFPLITFIDTAGPSISLEAEERGLGHAIATTLAQMAELPVPTVAVIIGEGGREGALALGVADRILMLESAIYTPISPEGAATLMYRDDTRTEEAARALRLTAAEALEMKIIDNVVPEPPAGAHEDPEASAALLQRALVRALAQVQGLSRDRRLKRRYKKFRNMGEYTPYFRMALAREIETLQGYVVAQVQGARRRRRRRGRRGETKTPPEATSSPGETTETSPAPDEE